MGDEDPASRVEVRRDVVAEESLELLLGWLWSVLRDLLESPVGRGKDSVVGLSAVESLDEVRELIDQLGKLGGVL